MSTETGMTHGDLVARLERERISYPDELEAEGYRPGALENGHTPITEEQAARNPALLETWPEEAEED